ncbi:MAG: universal stress protein [Pseudomonadota bacterium]
MSKILACVDGSVYADSVVDHAAWAAQRLSLPVDVMQVLGRRDAQSTDRSGRIVAGARRKLLEELASLDAERAKLAQEEAWLALAEAKTRLQDKGVGAVTTALRQGDLLDAMVEREADAALIVIGKRGEAADFAKLHLGSNLERIIRAARRPILIASRAFQPVTRALIAFDGSDSALKAVEEMARSPHFGGLSCRLVTVGAESAASRAALDQSAETLSDAGLTVQTQIVAGQPETAIAAAVGEAGADLLVMGAYGHSRLRNLVIGSTTSALIRACQIPVMIYR